MNDFLEVTAFVGFIVTWLGFVILAVPMSIRQIFNKRIWAALFESYSDYVRLNHELLNHELNTVGKTRLGRLGGILVAIGSSILMFWFVVWLIEKIVSK